jgi:hypothetical protein
MIDWTDVCRDNSDNPDSPEVCSQAERCEYCVRTAELRNESIAQARATLDRESAYPSGGRGESRIPEIEVTPSMIQAGLDELGNHLMQSDLTYVIECVFREMLYEMQSPTNPPSEPLSKQPSGNPG